MQKQRWRPVFLSGLVLISVWLIAWGGHTLARNSKVTPERVAAYVSSIDLTRLSGRARADAIRKLEEMLNALSIEERRQLRIERTTWAWLKQMTEEEKSAFLEATMPTGFKQMLTAFEQLPEEKRRRTIEDALRKIQESKGKNNSETSDANTPGSNAPPVLSEELQAKVRAIGLQTFYSQSSAQTKAELAPVLEEVQRSMESGRAFRGR
jgi:hypothetical protein